MEQKETTTPQQKKIPSPENEQPSATIDKSPTTPTSPTSSTWWGGWISQAKEKVRHFNDFGYFPISTDNFLYCSQHL